MSDHRRPSSLARVFTAAAISLSAVGLSTTLAPPATHALSVDIVISQVYGGGGNAGATYTNDYIELFNRSSAPVSIDGWSVQYAAAAGTNWTVTAVSGTVQPGQYYLVQQRQGAGGTTPLPTPDAIGNIAMSAVSGKVALVGSTASLTGSCPVASTVDLVGYGSANCFEGSGAGPSLNNTTAAFRLGGGCVETDDNATDVASATPGPRNTASPLSPCVVPEVPIHVVKVDDQDMDDTIDLTVDPRVPGAVFDLYVGGATTPDDTVTSSLSGIQPTAAASDLLGDVAVGTPWVVCEASPPGWLFDFAVPAASAGDPEGAGRPCMTGTVSAADLTAGRIDLFWANDAIPPPTTTSTTTTSTTTTTTTTVPVATTTSPNTTAGPATSTTSTTSTTTTEPATIEPPDPTTTTTTDPRVGAVLPATGGGAGPLVPISFVLVASGTLLAAWSGRRRTIR